MSETTISEIAQKPRISNMILARTLKKGSDFNQKKDDLRTLFKLKENHIKISRLSRNLFGEDFDSVEYIADEEGFSENLKAIDEILHNLHRELRNL